MPLRHQATKKNLGVFVPPRRGKKSKSFWHKHIPKLELGNERNERKGRPGILA